MKYMGSKRRVAKYILPLILEGRSSGQWYVEPFVGGANLIDKVEGNRLGADSNKYLIALLNAMTKGWVPEENFTEKLYKEIRDNKNHFPAYLVGYVGFALSYGGKFFGGWRRDSAEKRNYVAEALSNYMKQMPKLGGCKFVCEDYRSLIIPEKSIIYCDPPYSSTTPYSTKFDSLQYYDWLREKKLEGHSVFCSEYDMPPDFRVLWEGSLCSSLTVDTGEKKAKERLFKL